MKTHAVVQAGGKQYLVVKGMEIIVDNLNQNVDDIIELPALMTFDQETAGVQLGTPTLKTAVKAQVMENMKGDKVRIAKFKSKVRFRKLGGFRAQLTRLKITSI